ncbi:MAG: hypothetical protein ABL928_13005 [Sphingorhabdus sp.]
MPKHPPSSEKASLPADPLHFAPVPRKQYRENGWIPARQAAFVQRLAETGSVRQAAAAVNMSRVSCYNLKNHAQGAGFARAWDAALDIGVQHLKDIAFERAVEGRLDPVWQAGKLVGHKRVYSDGLLMFLLRQYGTDANGRNVTVQYVRTRAAVAAHQGEAGAAAAEAEATTMTVRSNKASAKDSRKQDAAALVIDGFEGCALDDTAHAEIAATLAACAARQRELGGSYDDRETTSFTAGKDTPLWLGTLEPPYGWVEDVEPFDPAEPSWQTIGDETYLDKDESESGGDDDRC